MNNQLDKDSFVDARNTSSMGNAGGIPMAIPNITLGCSGFYISYNTRDRATYGGVTTALCAVIEDNTQFYILNGDHRQAYADLKDQGFDACMDYFRSHIDQISKYSDHPDFITKFVDGELVKVPVAS